jgi:hypothetical protein
MLSAIERLRLEGRMRKMPRDGHEIIVGTIGMGKSYWVLHKILRSLSDDAPLMYIDPKGDTYRNLLSLLSSSRQGRELWARLRHRILLINPVSPSDYLVGFNALEPMGDFHHAHPDKIALVANSLTSHIRRESGFELSEAMRMQNILSAAMGTLLEGGVGRFTLAEIPLLFVPHYRFEGKRRVPSTYNPLVERLLQSVEHHGVRSFWQHQWATWRPDDRRSWVQSTEGRIYRYLFDSRMLYSCCTSTHSRLDFRRVVDEGLWVFVNIPYPILGDTISTLLGNILITKLFYACMQRPPGERSYRLILDEARFFNTGPLDMLLETSRAYNLWLTMVVQSLNQMCRMGSGAVDERLKETALNNVRYLSVFHNTADTRLLANLMFPLTGQVEVGERANGDPQYLPVSAEVNEYERRFLRLSPRRLVLYDKFRPNDVKVYTTPQVEPGQASQGQINLFEGEHLRLTGVPLAEIKREIDERQAVLTALIEGEGSRPAPTPSVQFNFDGRFQ